ncbi:MAG: DUF4442 domain-containing protein [Myxococcales bacterium]|nr:DUF4442 domain-containing protein [Myxococcales bacterium]
MDALQQFGDDSFMGGLMRSPRRETFLMRLAGFLKIPVLNYVKPRFVEMNDEYSVLCIPLTRRTKNHVNSMYFAVLAAGADAASGFLAARHISNTKKNIVLVFKDVQGDFLKRADGDAYFTCRNGPDIAAAVARASETGERQNVLCEIDVTCPKTQGEEPVAKFRMTLSMKDKS